MKVWILTLALSFAFAASTKPVKGIRQVSSTSCEIVPVNLGLGMTTQLVFEQEPKVTLFADKKHFKVVTNSSSPRSLAIIPVIEGNELENFSIGHSLLANSAALVKFLNKSFRTNLFVFFDNNNQLMFELKFTEKPKADYILKVTQKFNGSCEL